MLTGFLGSGQTTVLNRLLASPKNEGDGGLINQLRQIRLGVVVRAVRGNSVVPHNGCICCSIQKDLQRALLDPIDSKLARPLAQIERVVIETTGFTILSGSLERCFMTQCFSIRSWWLKGLGRRWCTVNLCVLAGIGAVRRCIPMHNGGCGGRQASMAWPRSTDQAARRFELKLDGFSRATLMAVGGRAEAAFLVFSSA